MFQYASARALSLEYEIPLSLDTSEFSSYSLHQGYQLQRVFNIDAKIIDDVSMRNTLGWQAISFAKALLLRPGMAIFRNKKFIVEPHFHYWPKIKDVPYDCYIAGYWQSEKYFSKFSPWIRDDFSFIQPLNIKNSELVDQITHVNAVSLHVRRGDYVNSQMTSKVYENLSSTYYDAAIRHIVERISNPFFFIFSDDINWVRKNLKINFPCVYIDNNHGTESYIDMRLMSLCKFNIIANSSFSWWGAWLNKSREKIVVAPKCWFANGTNTQDLIPQNWIKL